MSRARSGRTARSWPTIPPTSAFTPTSNANCPRFARRPSRTSRACATFAVSAPDGAAYVVCAITRSVDPSATGRTDGCDALRMRPGRAQEREGVPDPLLEDFVCQLPVGEGAGDLKCADHQGEDTKRDCARRPGVVGCQSGGRIIDDRQLTV